MPTLAGFLYDSSGAAVNAATVNVYARNTTTPVVATTTTNSSGYWQTAGVAEGRYDVEIVSGTTTIRMKYDDEIQVERLEAKNLQVRGSDNAFAYTLAGGAISAARTLNLPVITTTDTVVVTTLAQTLASKTLTSPTITTSPTAAGATWTDLGTVTTADINGGSLDGVTIGAAAAAAATVTNLTVTGDLTVQGDTVTVNVATLSVEDPLIYLANGNTSTDTVDIGWYGVYDTSGSQDLHAGMFRDATDGKIKAFVGLQTAPTTTVNTGGTGYAGATLVVGTLEPSANDSGALGVSGTAFSDLFLASGAVINFAAGDVTLTHSTDTLTIGGIATLLDIAAGIVEVNNAIRFDTGVAIVSTSYSIGRDADGTNQLHLNVPTGATFEFSVNDVAQMVLGASSLTGNVVGTGSSQVAAGDHTHTSAPTDATYVTLTTNGTLTNERVLTGTSNQIVVTDNGAGSTVVLSTPQNLHTAATPQFASMGLGAAAAANVTLGLTAGSTYTLHVSSASDSTTAAGGITFGSSADTTLYRSGANTLQTDDDFVVKRAASGGNVTHTIENTSNTGSANTRLLVTAGGSSAGDPFIALSITGVLDWTIGLDNDDSDKFKIGSNFAVGTNTRLTISTTQVQVNVNDVVGASAGTLRQSEGVRIGADSTNNLLDDASTGGATATLYIGNASINVTSDVRVKDGVQSWNGSGLDLLRRLDVVEYRYRDHHPYGGQDDVFVGFTAQGLAQVTPWAVNYQGGRDCWECRAGLLCEDHQPWQARFEMLTGAIVKGVQELDARVTELESENTKLRERVVALGG